MSTEPRDLAIAAISRYLQQYPAATNTLEGIHQYWLGQGHALPLEATQAAIQELAERGVVETVRMGKHEIWRLAVSSADKS